MPLDQRDLRPESRRTGWRAPPGDAAALADRIAHALSLSDSQRDALAVRARAHVVENFSLERMCERTLAVYDGLLEDRRAAAWATR